jgi:hypothetical protein
VKEEKCTKMSKGWEQAINGKKKCRQPRQV